MCHVLGDFQAQYRQSSRLAAHAASESKIEREQVGRREMSKDERSEKKVNACTGPRTAHRKIVGRN
jgi:hypothetical protein